MYNIIIKNDICDKLVDIIKSLPYDIYCIQHRSLTNNYPFKNERVKIEKKIYRKPEDTYLVSLPRIQSLH